ncbi:MAG: hypothetical protein SVW57_07685 [Thermodesulfobacteriota bacterium]|nr:hypothetical protein [Thermodesulfobacteriota bacterium]
MNVGTEADMTREEVAIKYKKNKEKLIHSKTRPAIEKIIVMYVIKAVLIPVPQ